MLFECETDTIRACLHCGNYATTLKGRFQLICGTPPYNIGTKGPAIVGNRINHNGYDYRSFGGVRSYEDTLPEEVYQAQQIEFLLWCYDHLQFKGRVIYVVKDRYKNKELLIPEQWILKQDKLAIDTRIVWDRGSTHNWDTKRPCIQTEWVYVLRRKEDKGRASYMDTEPDEFTPKYGDSRSNYWRIPPEHNRNSRHDASLPTVLWLRIIKKWCPQGGAICDPYAGCGTGMRAAIKLGRNYVGAEIKKQFFDECREKTLQRIRVTSAQTMCSSPRLRRSTLNQSISFATPPTAKELSGIRLT